MRFSVYLSVVRSEHETADEVAFVEADSKAELFQGLGRVLREIARETEAEGEFWGLTEGLELD